MSILGAYIVPHPPLIITEIGKGEERQVENTINAYHRIAQEIAALCPDTVVITTPHSIMYSDYFHISPGAKAYGNFGRFGAEQVAFTVDYDSDFVDLLEKNAEKEGIEAGTLGEKEPSLDHGTMVPLYFINQYLSNSKLVRIGISGLSFTDHYRLGKCIAKSAEHLRRRVVVVASGDLSHKLKADGPYGRSEEGIQFDNEVTEAMKSGDFLKLMELNPDFCEAAGECGLRSFIIMAGALDGKDVEAKLLSYEGSFGVGYAVATYEIKKDNEGRHFDLIYKMKQREYAKQQQESEDVYVHLARLSLESYIKTGKYTKLPKELPEDLLGSKAGVFVSIKKHGSLRGCIGTIAPVTDNIAEEILRNAISAGVEDPRFPPVTEAELEELTYSVDVLGKAEPIKFIEELNVKKYGIIVSKGRKRGLLLPNLEGVDTVEQQIEIAKRKAGIYQNEACTMERFEVVRHK